jgi:hypothetical protein
MGEQLPAPKIPAYFKKGSQRRKRPTDKGFNQIPSLRARQPLLSQKSPFASPCHVIYNDRRVGFICSGAIIPQSPLDLRVGWERKVRAPQE